MSVSMPPSTVYGYHDVSVDKPAPATGAVVTLAAPAAGLRHLIKKIIASYTATPTGGSLTISLGAKTITVFMASAGPLELDFPEGLAGDDGAAVVITLTSGGGAVEGSLAVLHH